MSAQVPWTVLFADGSNNNFTFGQTAEDAPATFAYVPVTPEQSSSGLYSGGQPKQGNLNPEQSAALWEWVNRMAADTEAHLVDQRPKGSGQVDVQSGEQEQSFVLANGETLKGFGAFVEAFRGTSAP